MSTSKTFPSPPPPPYINALSIPVPILIPNAVKPHRTGSEHYSCLGPELWTYIIAGVQIFLGTALIAFAFVTKPKRAEMIDAEYRGDSDFNEQSSFDQVKLIYFQYAFSTKVLLFDGTVLLVKGSVLVAGARLEKPGLLIIWCIATIVSMGAYVLTLLILLLLFIFGSGSYLLLIFLIVLVPFMVHFLCLSIVSTYRHELVNLQKRLHPMNYLESSQTSVSVDGFNSRRFKF